MPHAFSQRLAAGALLCDGAMGTMLYARGVSLDACFDVLNLNNPRLVQAIHADYVAAGADLIETNTFGANRFKLAVHGLEGQVREVNRRGVRLARDVRESTGRDVLVLGSVGPLGKYLAPLGSVTAEDARAAFREQAEGLLEGGVDAFIVETFSDLAEIALAIEAIRSVTDLPIAAEMAFTDEGVTFTGRSPAEVARTLRALGVQALGANCSVGSSTLYGVLEQMVEVAGGLPLAIQPNAGLPSRVGERLIYLSSPAYMAEYAARMVDAGARVVGGCCGTTPQHIAAMRETLDRKRPPRRDAVRPTVTVTTPAVGESAGLLTRRPATTLQRKLEAREFVVTVELDPPRPHRREARPGREAPQGARRRDRRHQRRLARSCADGRPADGAARAGGDRARHQHALHLSRPEPDGHPGRLARRPRARRPQHPRPQGRPAARRRLRQHHGGLRRQRDRPHRGPEADEPGTGRDR